MFQGPRAAQQSNDQHRQIPPIPYSGYYPITPAINTSQAPQPLPQQQQTQQAHQVPVIRAKSSALHIVDTTTKDTPLHPGRGRGRGFSIQITPVIDPFHVPQQPHQVPVIRARFSALRIFDTKRDFLTDDEVVTPPSSVLTPTTTQPPEILTTVVVPAPVVLAEEGEAPLTLPVTAKDLLESVIGMPSEDHVFAAEKGSGIINEDQWSPLNPEGKKTYDRHFLLQLQNNSASQKKPEGLPIILQRVRDIGGVPDGDIRGYSFVKMMPAKGLPEKNSHQGRGDQCQQQSPPRKENKLINSLMRQERPEDPDVRNPKHVSESQKEHEGSGLNNPKFQGSMGVISIDGGMGGGMLESTMVVAAATPISQISIDFQHSLENYLIDANQLTTDDVCSWIQKQYVGEVNTAFIRALVTAVSESSIEGRGKESKLNSIVLKHWTEVLRRYVDTKADRELQLLYAVQALVTKRQHPKGLIQGIFETLYASNVVSEKAFESWASAEDPLERQGKAVAMEMINTFLTWLKEADPESDKDADV